MSGEDQCDCCGGWDGEMGPDGEHDNLFDCIVELKAQRDKAVRARNEVLDRAAGVSTFAERMRAVEEGQRKRIAELADELLRLHWPTPEEITP
jgi:hypothetical protein